MALYLCSCSTPYRPLKGGTGYADTAISSDEFKVSFYGNGQTSSEQANDFALLRAAQITLDHQFCCFAVMDVTNASSAKPYVARQQFHSDYPSFMALGPPGYDPYVPGYTIYYEQPSIYFRPGIIMWIKCFLTKPAKPFTYNAAELAASVKRTYNLH